MITGFRLDPPSQHRARPMVLHIDECFGVGTYIVIRNIIAGLADRFDFAVLFGNRCDRSDATLHRDFPDVELRRWRHAFRDIRPADDLRALHQAVREIRRLNPDVVHCHSSKAGVLGRVAAALTGRLPRCIYTPHGISFCQTGHSRSQRRLFRRIEHTIATWGGVVVACSDSEKDALSNAGIQSVLIRNGVVPQQRRACSPIRARPPWRVITAGRIVAQKQPDRFNDLARLFLHRSDLEFRWVGDGELRSLLTSPNIAVLGWRTREEVDEEMVNADVYCSTSSSEGLPLAGLEAMSFGLPLLMSECIGNCDLVRLGNGYLFRDTSDAARWLTEALAMPQRLSRLGERSRQLVELEFSLAEMLAAYGSLYEQLSAGGRT